MVTYLAARDDRRVEVGGLCLDELVAHLADVDLRGQGVATLRTLAFGEVHRDLMYVLLVLLVLGLAGALDRVEHGDGGRPVLQVELERCRGDETAVYGGHLVHRRERGVRGHLRQGVARLYSILNFHENLFNLKLALKAAFSWPPFKSPIII